MRTIGTIAHPSMRISIFIMNDKYVVKFEAGPMEQVYKILLSEVKGIEEIEKMVEGDFTIKVLARFNEMFLCLKDAQDRKIK